MSPVQKVALIIALVNSEYGADVKPRATFPANDERNTARYMAMLLIRKHTSYTYAWIDKLFTFTNTRQMVMRLEDRLPLEYSLRVKLQSIETQFIEQTKSHR